jgi:hypothetical protein
LVYSNGGKNISQDGPRCALVAIWEAAFAGGARSLPKQTKGVAAAGGGCNHVNNKLALGVASGKKFFT